MAKLSDVWHDDRDRRVGGVRSPDNVKCQQGTPVLRIQTGALATDPSNRQRI
jgi:hypothetical protein